MIGKSAEGAWGRGESWGPERVPGELTEDTEFKKKNQPPKTNKQTSASSDWEMKLLAPLALGRITRRGAAFTLGNWTPGRGDRPASGLPQSPSAPRRDRPGPLGATFL